VEQERKTESIYRSTIFILIFVDRVKNEIPFAIFQWCKKNMIIIKNGATSSIYITIALVTGHFLLLVLRNLERR
jgi:hypothetical protein